MLSKYCFFHKTDSNQYIVFNSLLFEPIVIEEKEYLDLRDDNLKVFSDEELALLKQKGIIVQDDNTDNLALSKLKQHVNSAIQGGISLIYIIPSNICNLACKYCFIGQLNQSKIEISTEIIDKIISEYYNHLIKKNRSTATIVFYGGEPLTAFDKIKYTIEYCSKYKKIQWDFAVVTNLTLLTEEMAQYFELHDVSIGVSIDGPKATNDSNRIFKNNSNSVYECVLNRIKILKAHKINIGLSITLTNELLNDAKFLQWLEELDIKDINYNLMHFTQKTTEWEDYYRKASAFLFTSDKVLSSKGIIDDRLQRKIKAFNAKEFKYNDCGAIGGHQLCFAPNGEVTVCHGFWNSSEQHCGNILHNSFSDIIQTQIFREWQNNLTVNKDKCLNCPAIYICGGGCAMQSHDLFGNLNAIDEAFCIHSKYTLEILLNNLV
ncbi:MAG: radical SAM protein [Candidatus Borkfalkiaceae bacterium]|nr:radical SAM protein [Clostridia bacterium]MDY6223840.1 radical SAM protein [Christensenellaceae bacterium]